MSEPSQTPVPQCLPLPPTAVCPFCLLLQVEASQGPHQSHAASLGVSFWFVWVFLHLSGLKVKSTSLHKSPRFRHSITASGNRRRRWVCAIHKSLVTRYCCFTQGSARVRELELFRPLFHTVRTLAGRIHCRAHLRIVLILLSHMPTTSQVHLEP